MSKENWFTPQYVIDASLATLDCKEFDMDPCSHPQALIPARLHYTEQQDGLVSPWRGKILLNPPYTARIIDRWIAKLADHYRNGDIRDAVVIVPARISSGWQKPLKRFPLCLPDKRIEFVPGPGVTATRPNFDSILYYLGVWPDRFIEAFAKIGPVHLPARMGS